MTVVIAPHIKRTKTLIDSSGNELDPKTKQIIKRNEPEYIPTKEEIEAKINLPVQPVPISPPIQPSFQIQPETKLTIQQEIDQAREHLANLELKKKEIIAQRKKELAELEESE